MQKHICAFGLSQGRQFPHSEKDCQIKKKSTKKRSKCCPSIKSKVGSNLAQKVGSFAEKNMIGCGFKSILVIVESSLSNQDTDIVIHTRIVYK